MEDIKDIKLYEQSRYYSFFLFALTISDIIFFGDDFWRPSSNTDKTELQNRLNDLTDSMLLTKLDDEQNSFSLLSLTNILSLLDLTDSLAKSLLTSNDDNLRELLDSVSNKRPDIDKDWDKAFLKEASFVFREMKDAFKSYPEIVKYIEDRK